jgi:hypothetical protein
MRQAPFHTIIELPVDPFHRRSANPSYSSTTQVLMAMSTVSASHVRLDDRGVAWIDDSNVKVVEVALEHIAHGSSPEEICEQHDGYLAMAQIHGALTHYYDHQSEYDAARAGCLDSPGRRRLRALGKLE